MLEYDLASAIGAGTTTMTRKAAMRRGAAAARNGGGGARGPDAADGAGGATGGGAHTPAKTAALVPLQDQALAWSQKQQPALGSRPHTRAALRVPGLAVHGAEVAGVVSRPATRHSTGARPGVGGGLALARAHPGGAPCSVLLSVPGRAHLHTRCRQQRRQALAVGDSRTSVAQAQRCATRASAHTRMRSDTQLPPPRSPLR